MERQTDRQNEGEKRLEKKIINTLWEKLRFLLEHRIFNSARMIEKLIFRGRWNG